MSPRIILIVLAAFLNLLNCSGDKTEKLAPKPQEMQSTPAPGGLRPNAPSQQDLQPDLHVSGAPSTHISGVNSTSEHISGQ